MEATVLALALGVGLVAGAALVRYRRPDAPRVPPPAGPAERVIVMTAEEARTFNLADALAQDASIYILHGHYHEAAQLWLLAAQETPRMDARQACFSNALEAYQHARIVYWQ